MSQIDFDQIKLDVLREITSISTAHAATSLSDMVGKRVDISVPNILVETVEKIPEVLGGREKYVTVVYFSVEGQVSGSILLVLSPPESLRLAHLLTGEKADRIENLDEMGQSALKELGNIITGSYVRIIAQELKMRVRYSIPGFAYDMFGAILDEILARIALEAQNAIITESEFMVRKEVYRGHLIFILSPKAANAIIKALGKWGLR